MICYISLKKNQIQTHTPHKMSFYTSYTGEKVVDFPSKLSKQCKRWVKSKQDIIISILSEYKWQKILNQTTKQIPCLQCFTLFASFLTEALWVPQYVPPGNTKLMLVLKIQNQADYRWLVTVFLLIRFQLNSITQCSLCCHEMNGRMKMNEQNCWNWLIPTCRQVD